MLFVLVPAGDTTPVDVGDVAQSDEPWRLPLDRFVVATQEGTVIMQPDVERRRFHQARDLKRGDLVIAIDGQPLDGSDASLALALLDGPGRHDLLVRGPHREVHVVCPPGKQGMHLPVRRGRDLPGMGTDYTMVVEPLPRDHPWSSCLERDDLVVAVATNPKTQQGVNGRSSEIVDAALASGLPVSVSVRRRGPSRHVTFPAR